LYREVDMSLCTRSNSDRRRSKDVASFYEGDGAVV
jgi:hypothetical protein